MCNQDKIEMVRKCLVLADLLIEQADKLIQHNKIRGKYITNLNGHIMSTTVMRLELETLKTELDADAAKSKS